MLNVKNRIFLIVSIAVLLVLAGVILVYVLTKDKEPIVETPTATSTYQIDETNFDNSTLNGTKATVVPAGTKVKVATTEEIEKNAVIQLAKIFTERYGTYSTHGEYENIQDVLPLSTDSFASVLGAKLPENTNKTEFGAYQGVTVQAIATEISDWQADIAATVVVNVIKTESKDGKTSNVNVKAEVKMKKVGENWLIDGFAWN